MQRLRMNSTIPPDPHTLSLHAERQLLLTLVTTRAGQTRIGLSWMKCEMLMVVSIMVTVLW
jgi:hypothetical protein